MRVDNFLQGRPLRTSVQHMEVKRCSRCQGLKPVDAFPMRSDKPYRRGWCTECLNAWQRARRAILKEEAEAWRARTKHGSKGGRNAAAKGDWLRNMAPVAKARYIRDANLDSAECVVFSAATCNRAIGLLDENPELFDRAKEYVLRFKEHNSTERG